MKCLAHKAEAVAVCAYCGRGLCSDCLQVSGASRLVCSVACAEALALHDRGLSMILQQGVQNAKASAFYCYLCGGLSAAAAVVAWFILPSTFLMLFTAGCALVLVVSGLWYGRIARTKSSLDRIPIRSGSMVSGKAVAVASEEGAGKSSGRDSPVEVVSG